MPEYLSPEEVERWAVHCDESCGELCRTEDCRAAATLREMAAVVEWVASDEPVASYEGRCVYCGESRENHYVGDDVTRPIWYGVEHKPDCIYIRARRLRGLQ